MGHVSGAVAYDIHEDAIRAQLKFECRNLDSKMVEKIVQKHIDAACIQIASELISNGQRSDDQPIQDPDPRNTSP